MDRSRYIIHEPYEYLPEEAEQRYIFKRMVEDVFPMVLAMYMIGKAFCKINDIKKLYETPPR